MEAFTLLKYWRGGGGLGVVSGGGGGDSCGNSRTASGTTTMATAVNTHQAVDTDDDGDDGPFFDLEFAIPDVDEAEEETEGNGKTERGNAGEEEGSWSESDGEEFNFTLSSDSSNDLTDPNLALLPSDDLFFKGRLVSVEANSTLDSKLPQFPVFLLKSATKFRFLLLRFKNSKLNAGVKTGETNGSPTKQDETHEESNKGNNKSEFLTVKFKVEEVPVVSLFTRDNSKSQKQQNPEESVSDEKKFSRDVMQKYLKKVKPLYVRVSRRYGERLRLSGQLGRNPLKPTVTATIPSSTVAQKSSPVKSTAEKVQPEAEVSENQTNNVKSHKQGNNIPTRLRVACKHLGKSRSASSAVAVAPSPVLSQRRDDSLLQQEDGIQGAILHCKRSFNGSRDSESSMLPRCVSDPSMKSPLIVKK